MDARFAKMTQGVLIRTIDKLTVIFGLCLTLRLSLKRCSGRDALAIDPSDDGVSVPQQYKGDGDSELVRDCVGLELNDVSLYSG